MPEALVVAQSQSVKEIKEKSKIKKIHKIVTYVIIAVVIIAVIGYLSYNYINKTKFEFKMTQSGVAFYSNDFPVADAMNILSQDNNVLLVLDFKEKDLNFLANISESVIYMHSVLGAKQKNVLFVINTLNDERRIVGCQSNMGDIYENKTLTADECKLLLDSNRTSIIIDYPDNSLKNTSVYASVTEKFIYIKSDDTDGLKRAVQGISELLFSDIDEINKSIENFNKSFNDKSLSKAIDGNSLVGDSNLSDSNTIYTSAMVSSHSSGSDCWIIVDKNIYNVTSYLNHHPAGPDFITPFCGKDATAGFNSKPTNGMPHSANAKNLLAEYYVGRIS